PLRHLVEEAGTPEVLREIVGGDADGLALTLRDAARNLASDGGDLPVEAPHPRFACVPAHDLADGLGLEGKLGGGDAVRHELLGDEVLPGNSHLLLVRVAGEGE